MEEQETEQQEDVNLSEEVAPTQNDVAPSMDFSMPEITMEDIFDTSLLPSF